MKLTPTLKSLLRGLVGVAVGIGLVLAKDPKYAPVGAVIPFILRYMDPSEKEIGIGKAIGNDIKP